MHLATSKNTLAISEKNKQKQNKNKQKKKKKPKKTNQTKKNKQTNKQTKKTDTFLLLVPILYNEGTRVIDAIATKRI